MDTADRAPLAGKGWFLSGVFLVSLSLLVLQIVQTRILSVIAWYYLAFFAISVAMLGMTTGAVWVYLRTGALDGPALCRRLAAGTLAFALSLPLSLALQFSLVTTLTLSLTTVVSWTLLLLAMALPYVFAGVVLSLALTRSPYPVNLVYGVDLLGAALGCVAVVGLLDVLDAPTVLLVAGIVAAVAAMAFRRAGRTLEPDGIWKGSAATWVLIAGLAALAAANFTPYGIKPLLVKDRLETTSRSSYERWNSYSRIRATAPINLPPLMWGASPKLPPELRARQVLLNIDGEAGTVMPQYDGTPQSIEFLRYDIVNLAYALPGLRKSAVIGVGGGRDILSAHLHGVADITGVELNPIFIDLHTSHPRYSRFSNLKSLPNLKLHVDDARSWFAGTDEKFDLIQMSMIDTWAATGAGAFSLSENGLYTLEGWRTFLAALQPGGFFTVSRWYNPSDINETGRMIGLATAALLDAGVADARPHLFVVNVGRIATLVLAKRPFTEDQLAALRARVAALGYEVLLAPGQLPKSPLLAAMVASTSIPELDRAVAGAPLDLSVPTDRRPFFFNQLKFSRIPSVTREILNQRQFAGVLKGNLQASSALLLILAISLVAVTVTILLPLRAAVRAAPRPLVAAGTLYFSLIGLGFMFAEISLLQHFSLYLGHPIYSLGVCLFSLILATGLGSLLSGKLALDVPRGFLIWAGLLVVLLLGLQQALMAVLHATTAQPLGARIGIALLVLMPLGLLLGFAFPTGIRLVERLDRGPTPWFWGINGATGVLASVLAVILGMAFGIHVTLLLAGLCYLALVPAGLWLMRLTAAPVTRSALLPAA